MRFIFTTHCQDVFTTVLVKLKHSFFGWIAFDEWEEIPQTFFASVPKRKGSKEILDFIENTNLLFTS